MLHVIYVMNVFKEYTLAASIPQDRNQLIDFSYSDRNQLSNKLLQLFSDLSVCLFIWINQNCRNCRNFNHIANVLIIVFSAM